MSRLFRVFVSSTFSDLKAERDALQEQVFPRLREFCRQRGARFQAIDLRWGISEEAALDQQTMRVCLDELHHCQEVTPRPNFIVLLGQRYGWRPAPASIPADEFAAVYAATTDASDRALLERWYRRDDNAMPPEHVLQPRVRGSEYERAEVWGEVETRLRRALRRALPAYITQEARAKYECSATEQEIQAGALAVGAPYVHAYVRTIPDLPADAWEYRDADADAEAMLEALIARLKGSLPDDYYHEYTAAWSGDGVTAAHLQLLCSRVYDDLVHIILEELADLESVSQLDQEIEAHRAFAGERAQGFQARTDAARVISDYLASDDPRPLVVTGRAGSGKSALLAHCLQEAAKSYPRAVAIARFIGASPESTDIRSLLQGLCQQLMREFGDEYESQKQQRLAAIMVDSGSAAERREAIASEYEPLGDAQHLALVLSQLLDNCPPSRPVLVFLDSLDQLSLVGSPQYLSWLPVELPSHVRLVVSVLDDEGDTGMFVRAARRRLRESLFLEVPPLTAEEGSSLLDHWCDVSKRVLTSEQRRSVLTGLEHSPYPLYLKLAFQEARCWRSYEALPTGADGVPGLACTIEGVIADLLWRLEQPAQHGPVLVSKALGYLAASRNGLTEDEMLDVLAEDGDVWSSLIADTYHMPQERRLPVAIWARLRRDLAPYLSERSADGASVLGFYHRQLDRVVAERYLTDTQRAHAHSALARHFLAQAHMDSGPDGSPRPNRRQLAELPYHLAYAGMWTELESLLTDYTFLEAAYSAGRRQDYAQQCETIRRLAPPPACDVAWELSVFLRANYLESAENVETLGPDLHNWADTGATAALASQWAQQQVGSAKLWLKRLNRPPSVRRLASRSHLVGHGDVIWHVAIGEEGKSLLSASRDGTIRIWDTEAGICTNTLLNETNIGRCVADERLSRAVCVTIDGRIVVWDPVVGSVIRRARADGRWPDVLPLVSPDGEKFGWLESQGYLRVFTDLSSGDHYELDLSIRPVAAALRDDLVLWVASREGGIIRLDLKADGKPRTLAQVRGRPTMLWPDTPGDGVWVWLRRETAAKPSHSGSRSAELCCLDAQGKVHHRHNQLPSSVVSADVDTANGICVGGDEAGGVWLWDDLRGSGRLVARVGGHPTEVLSVAARSASGLAATGGWDWTIRVWGLEQLAQLGVCSEPPMRAVAAGGSGRTAGSDNDLLSTWGAPSYDDSSVSLEGDAGLSVALTDQDTKIMCGHMSGNVSLFSVPALQLLRRKRAHLTPVQETIPLSGTRLALTIDMPFTEAEWSARLRQFLDWRMAGLRENLLRSSYPNLPTIGARPRASDRGRAAVWEATCLRFLGWLPRGRGAFVSAADLGNGCVAVGQDDGVVSLWDCTRRSRLGEVRVGRYAVSSLSWSSEDRTLWVASAQSVTALPLPFHGSPAGVWEFEAMPVELVAGPRSCVVATMDAREDMHLIPLRSSPALHPYRLDLDASDAPAISSPRFQYEGSEGVNSLVGPIWRDGLGPLFIGAGAAELKPYVWLWEWYTPAPLAQLRVNGGDVKLACTGTCVIAGDGSGEAHVLDVVGTVG